jgi:gamma-glutamyltranspeptidase/glutathione hydrolase
VDTRPADRFAWDFPYPSRRLPVAARNVVATSQPLAVQAGLEALRRGGNAVDAAIATAVTLTVVEPNNNGVGSDAFAIVWDGTRLHGLNASGRAPLAWRRERFAGRAAMPALGWESVTVPGAVSAWAELSARFGRLPFARLFDAAIGYAHDGFPVGPKTATFWSYASERYAEFTEFVAHFCPGGRSPAPGAIFRRPDLAATLAEIAATRGDSFYRGALAERIVACASAAGAALDASDLEHHAPTWIDPIPQPYRDIVLHEMPPNAQGLAAQIALGILAHHDLSRFAPDSVDAVHLQIEAMKVAIRAAFEHFADADAMRVSPARLLGEERLAALARGIGAQAAAVPQALLPTGPDTVYLAAGDAEGMMVSMIQSNYQGFGSGIVIPGTGIAMQNRGRGFVLDPAHPNCVGPGKRPYHTIIPGFVTDAGGARLAFGVMGGHMQHQGHVQMVTRIFDHRQNPQAASDAPRWHVYEDMSVGLESGHSSELLTGLAARGHRVRQERREFVFGGAQLVYRIEDAYVAASDHRKEGQAAGF